MRRGSKLERALITIGEVERGEAQTKLVGALPLTICTFVYIGILLSLPLTSLKAMIFMAAYLALAAPYLGISYGKLFVRSLYVLPFILFIGIFNPLIDRTPAVTIYGTRISVGWLSFIGLVIRGLLAVQMVLLLISEVGFRGFCGALQQMRVPSFMVTQLLMSYRYLKVLLEEALVMRRARESRGYGRKMPVRMWGRFIGELFMRSLSRSERIHQAMLSRGFDGKMPTGYYTASGRTANDIWYMVISIASFAAIRIFAV